MKRLCIVLLFLFSSLQPLGCLFDDQGVKDDLALAEKALNDRDFGDAEMFFERYLRKNADGDMRWEVWRQLLSVSLDVRQDKATAKDYLEIMLLEFADDAPKRRQIQMELARICTELRLYSRALELWESLAIDPELSPADRAAVYQALSYGYLRRLEFSAATDVLGLCLNLDLDSDAKADCLFALAETLMLTDELDKSEQRFRDLLVLPGLSADRKVLATFMLADVLEQENKLQEAWSFFESIRDSHPNKGVVEVRLNALRGKIASQ